MSKGWYAKLRKKDPLTQGEMIFDFPILQWNSDQSSRSSSLIFKTADEFKGDQRKLLQTLNIVNTDVIIMSQSCDLEHKKLRNVVLCPHWSIDTYKSAWELDRRNKNQNPTSKAWNNFLGDLCDGYIWNLTILGKNSLSNPEMTQRVVDFHEIYTVPIEFILKFVQKPKIKRFYLLPP